MKIKRKADIILIAAALIIGGILIAYFYNREAHALRLEITLYNEVVFDEPVKNLDLPYTFTADGPFGDVNEYVVDEFEDGTIGVYCAYSNCWEQICVYTGVITLPDSVIVCLPHRAVARLYNP